MAVQSKRKGNTGERECAALLSKHLGGSFQKVSHSGAFIGGKNAFRKTSMSVNQIRAMKSDIIPPDEYSKLVTEVKFYKDLPYHAFATCSDIPKLDGWIKELEFDCDDTDFGILCFKINRKGWSICFHTKYKDDFKLDMYIQYKDYIVTGFENFLLNNKDQIIKIITQ